MPEPVLVAIAAALTGRAAGSLYDLVNKRFARNPAAAEALAAAECAAKDSPEVAQLATALEVAERDDAAFSEALRVEWERASQTQHAEGSEVINQVSGKVSGNLVQARDVHGNITL
jgi:hypothetical protein